MILIMQIQKIYLSIVFFKPKSVFWNIGFNSFKIKDHFDKKCAKSLQILARIRIFNHSQTHNTRLSIFNNISNNEIGSIVILK